LIIDGPITYDLTVGSDRRIPQDGDAQIQVPPSVLPVVLALRKTTFKNSFGNAVPVSSLLVQADVSRVNQAALTQTLTTLAVGLWELELTLATQFNYLSAVGTLNGAHIQLVDAVGTTIRLLSRFANVGTFTDFNRVRLLFDQQATLNLEANLTGVGQNLDARACVNCIRIL
jgi:hypothetical protein